MKARSYLLFLLAFNFVILGGQTRLYEWRSHFSYTYGQDVATGPGSSYCVTTGGLFRVDKDDNSVQKLSKINGLSDVGYSTIAYNSTENLYVLGYNDGNIDLIRDYKVINISDITRKQIIGVKSINDIMFIDHLAYLSCGFGIVVLDLSRQEIKETYFIGPNGKQVEVNQVTLFQNHLYAATNEGIFRANTSSPNLIDYNEWELLSFLADPTGNYKVIKAFGDKIYTVHERNPDEDEIIQMDNSSAGVFSEIGSSKRLNISTHGDRIFFSTYNSIQIYDNFLSLVDKVDSTVYWNPKPVDFISDGSNLWIADQGQGMVKYFLGTGKKNIYLPNGPRVNDAFNMDVKHNNLWVAAGSPSKMFTYQGGYAFQDEKWNSFHRLIQYEIWDIINYSYVSVCPNDEKLVFFGSYGGGIVEYYDNQFVKHYTSQNSVLKDIDGYEQNIRVKGIDFDKHNNLWIATSLTDQSIYVKPYNEPIEAVDLDYSGFSSMQRVGEIIVTSNDHKWVIVEQKGVLAFDNMPGNGNYNDKLVQVVDRNGDKISSIYLCLAEDMDGNIWLGTETGPVVFYNPEDVFDGTIYASQVLIPRDDGSGLADILLETEAINDIEIDGADRKWFATRSAGAFLVSKDGTKEISHFNTSNSPLPSDNINDIAIDHKTGEVFFATDKGIVSYKGSATKDNGVFANVYVYPNPVRPDFTGDIVISGLVEDVSVKITDIAGNLVYETRSLGGQAIWNGKNFDGIRVSTGVYLVFISNSDGTMTHTTKLLFIN